MTNKGMICMDSVCFDPELTAVVKSRCINKDLCWLPGLRSRVPICTVCSCWSSVYTECVAMRMSSKKTHEANRITERYAQTCSCEEYSPQRGVTSSWTTQNVHTSHVMTIVQYLRCNWCKHSFSKLTVHSSASEPSILLKWNLLQY